VQVVNGEARLNGQALRAGDGASATDEPRVEIAADAEAEILLFDLPMA
jgi:redox-sensitive bicupin YhaK (pirin superfamily)